MEKKTCSVFVDGQECGLELKKVEAEGIIYQCPVGASLLFFPLTRNEPSTKDQGDLPKKA
jgi:hypothetical protein